MIQGLSVGGEYTTSIIYMIEHTDPRKRGWIGSFAVSGAVGFLFEKGAAGAWGAHGQAQQSIENGIDAPQKGAVSSGRDVDDQCRWHTVSPVNQCLIPTDWRSL